MQLSLNNHSPVIHTLQVSDDDKVAIEDWTKGVKKMTDKQLGRRFAGIFSNSDCLKLVNNDFLPDSLVYRMCMHVKKLYNATDIYIEDPVTLAQLVSLKDLTLSTSALDNYVKLCKKKRVPNWLERLNKGHAVIFLVNYPHNYHWSLGAMYLKKKPNKFNMRIWNPCYNNCISDNLKIAQALGAAFYYMHGMFVMYLSLSCHVPVIVMYLSFPYHVPVIVLSFVQVMKTRSLSTKPRFGLFHWNSEIR